MMVKVNFDVDVIVMAKGLKLVRIVILLPSRQSLGKAIRYVV